FKVMGWYAMAAVRKVVRGGVFVTRTAGGAVRGALLLAIAVAFTHFGISVLLGRNDLPYRFLDGAGWGILVGAIYGACRTIVRPKALTPPTVCRPSSGQQIARLGLGTLRLTGLGAVAALFVALVVGASELQGRSLFSPGVNPNPPKVTRTNLSIVSPK